MLQQLAAPWLGSVKWANAGFVATLRMRYYHRGHPLLAIPVHRSILACELDDSVETQTTEF